MVSPTLGVGLLTDLPTARSDFCGNSSAPPLLLPGFGSNWSAVLTVAMLNWASGALTVARIWRVATAPLATVPTSHTPAMSSYVPWLGVEPTKERPAGRRSLTWTLVAASGPALDRVTVKVIVSPTLGRGSFTDFCICKSAFCGDSVAVGGLLT